MKNLFILVVFLLSWQFSIAQIVINELDPDTPSIDTAEFIEIKSETPNFSTDGYILVFFNGSSSGGDSSYMVIDLAGYTTDNNGLLVIGGSEVYPYPQYSIPDNVIQNGADAVGIYQASVEDFPEGTLATQTNLVDAMVYGTNDPDATGLLTLLGETTQYNDNGTNANPKSIQRFVDTMGGVTFAAATPTPRRENDGSGIPINPISITVSNTQVGEGDSFDITFTSEEVVASDVTFAISLDNYGFNNADYTGATSLTILAGQNSVSTTIATIDDDFDEGDEVAKIHFLDLVEPFVPGHNFIEVRIVDNDFTVAPFGTPLNSTYGNVASTQPDGYYDSLDGLADTDLRQALQDIIADPSVVRAQTYADVIDILKEADQNPENSNEVWLVYLEQGRAKLDFQTTSVNTGKWNREHTFPRSRAGYYSIEEDEVADGVDVFWTTKADSLRHGNSDAHALRAVDGPENSSRGNQFYGEYTGPAGTQGGFKGDVARGVFYLAVRYNGLEIVNGYPNGSVGQFGDLQTLLDWHRNDPPDDYEMNRNNVIYNWQFNRNPFIDQPDLIEYIWGNMVGESWSQTMSIAEADTVEVKVFPNPASDYIYINGISGEAKVDVFSVEGRKVHSFNIEGSTLLDLNLSKGMYVFRISSEGRVLNKKIIIQ
ncbi:putative secreted protein (Por secretion system target) [Oceanihabitans sediminis]|uniref:T9SS C-terminal target domain-containing protein n=1 Tax=Oceanihabitans sediminis TaxID=1812012 RepID=A0A368P6G3_9FLAO|nr:endonuclease [Oceanihabitans sediminis]MDX1774039.1 endonuclease [Oceanihabitans sediminis]RBP30922.1 putative secreted protein (Por secretion system target) [Oceanihabitans sediminis]RCU56881.1 T9SS C-terminal target domain-containing protein [Oceanihabitans sediminis]